MLGRQTLQVLHAAGLGDDGQVGDGAAALHQGGGGRAHISSGAR